MSSAAGKAQGTRQSQSGSYSDSRMLVDSVPDPAPPQSFSLCLTVQMSNKRKSLQSSDSNPTPPPLNWLLQCCLPELTPENKTLLHTQLWSGVCNTQMQLTRQQTNRKWKVAAGQWRLSMWLCCCRNWLPISRRASTGLDWTFPAFFPHGSAQNQLVGN